MAGNLLDNASKWAKGQIGVSMFAERGRSGSMLLIKIEDDGPGLTEEQARAVLRRGVKLDEKVQGSGLGLDIVKELVDVYGGSLQLKRSVLGLLASCGCRPPLGGLAAARRPHFRLIMRGIRPRPSSRDQCRRFSALPLVALMLLAGCASSRSVNSDLGPTLANPARW